MTISIIGCGWLGMPLAMSLIQSGYTIKGSTTSTEKLPLLTRHQIEAYLFNLATVDAHYTLSDLFSSDLIVFNIPPGRRDPNAEQNYAKPFIELLTKIKTSTHNPKIIFVSSTSVYDDTSGLIDESSPRSGNTGSAKALIAIENWLTTNYKSDNTILRFGGLYGVNRHPVLYMSGKSNLSNASKPVNLIHLLDCIEIIKHIITQNIFGEQLNCVADDHPARKHYYSSIAEKLKVPKPHFSEESQIYDKPKIISNKRLKEMMGYHFIYSSVFDGIESDY